MDREAFDLRRGRRRRANTDASLHPARLVPLFSGTTPAPLSRTVPPRRRHEGAPMNADRPPAVQFVFRRARAPWPRGESLPERGVCSRDYWLRFQIIQRRRRSILWPASRRSVRAHTDAPWQVAQTPLARIGRATMRADEPAALRQPANPDDWPASPAFWKVRASADAGSRRSAACTTCESGSRSQSRGGIGIGVQAGSIPRLPALDGRDRDRSGEPVKEPHP